MYDRNMNGELSQTPQDKRVLEETTDSSDSISVSKLKNKIMDKIKEQSEQNHMIFKTGNIKTLVFEEAP